MTRIIGLTGGIGSGKTTIANYFQSMGIPVYIADAEARKITQLPEIRNSIKAKFGISVFEDEKVSREKLAAVVFNSPEKLNELNAIIHPAVKKHFDKWLQNYSGQSIVIKETAILFESGSYKECDKIITVTAPLETRIKRVMQRDRTSKNEVLKRIGNQWTDEQRIAKSDFVIENTDLEQAKLQATQILKKLTIL